MGTLEVVGLSDLLGLELLRVGVKLPMRLLPSIEECRAPSGHSWPPKQTSAAAEAVDGQAFFGGASEVADEVDQISFCGWTPPLGERLYAIGVEWL